MDLVAKLLTVIGLGTIELWAAVPAGFALNLHPIVVGSAAAVGAVSGASAVALVGERLRAWLLRGRDAKERKGRHKLVRSIWQRYGVVGLGLLAPMLTGAPLGAALGLALGAPVGRLLFWIGLGVALWSTGLTLAVALGIAGVEALGR